MTFSFTPQALRRIGAYAICALCAVIAASDASARDARKAQRETIVEEIAPPTREGFDDIIVQLPPLAPVRRKAQASSPSVRERPTTAEKTPSEPLTQPIVAPTAPQALADPPRSTRATSASEAVKADAPQPSATPQIATPQASKPEPVEQKISAPPTAEAGDAPRAQDETPADVLEPTDLRSSAPAEEAAAAPSVAPDAAPAPDTELAAPDAESATPAPQPAVASSESEAEGAFFETWQLILAAVALGGLLYSRLRRKKGEPAPKSAVPPSRRVEQLLLLLKRARSEIGPIVEARLGGALAAWRTKSAALRRSSRDQAKDVGKGGAKAQRSIANWSEIATMLRARIAPARGASHPQAPAARLPASESAGAPRGVVSPADATERSGWDQPDHDGVELLEPGAAGTRAIVMNARKKLRAAQA